MASDKDTSEQLNFVASPFDAIRHMDGDREFWRARELSKILGYNRRENFENVIAKAKIACKYNEREVDDHFREVTKLIRAAKGAKHSIRDSSSLGMAATCWSLVLTPPSLSSVTPKNILQSKPGVKKWPMLIASPSYPKMKNA
jgi:hypothetical protein